MYPSSLPRVQPMSNLSDPCAGTLFGRVMSGRGVESQVVGTNKPNGIAEYRKSHLFPATKERPEGFRWLTTACALWLLAVEEF